MYLDQLNIINFCNIQEEKFNFHPSLNVFVGNNGMGKTNVLDAINYLCLTRSNFSRKDSFNINHDTDFMRLEGNFLVDKKLKRVEVKLQRGKRKIVEKNGKVYKKLAEHIGNFPLVMIAPKDNVLILDSSAERRKLIDKVLSQTNRQYLQDLMAYNKLIEQRNATLKSEVGLENIRQLISIYDEKIDPLAKSIFERRTGFIEELYPIFFDLYKKISNSSEEADIHYSSKLREDSYLTLSRMNMEKDYILNRTTVGIHKDDIVFRINNSSVKNFASQGQLKSLVLAFKLAQFIYLKSKTETTPIILLDDVFDKLDRTRVRHLVELLFEEKLGQVFISDTDRDRILSIFLETGLSFKLFEMQKGNCIFTDEQEKRVDGKKE